MKAIIKQYWWAIVVIILAPVALNYILQIPAFVRIVGNNTDWLTFWGSYLGGIISTLTALFILYKTLQQNHEENEKNREANELANENNRKLQIRVLDYQQQMQWLNLFRQASAEYVQLYNRNDLIAVANMFIVDPKVAHNMLKPLCDRAIVCDTKLAYWCKADEISKELRGKIATKFKLYDEVLQDIQSIITFRTNYPMLSFTQLVTNMQTMTMTQEMRNKIIQVSTKAYYNAAQPFFDVIMERSHDIQDSMGEVQSILEDYIRSEQARIDKILENGTDLK